MNMTPYFIAAALLAVAAPAASAQVVPFQLDHFKCYLPASVAPLIYPVAIRFQDQFGVGNPLIGDPFRLCNPTRKIHNGQATPIRWPDNHLMMHRMSPQPVINRRVMVRNQFGDQTLITRDARVLAVPTQKQPHDAPQGLSHYACYEAEGPLQDVPVRLEDQFFGSNHRVARPVLFCNPAQKWHNGTVSPIANPLDHLTCYNITNQPYSRVVDTRNQFGQFRLQTAAADMLCVPSLKLGWEVLN
jgi:hypothetical protein